MANKCTIVHFVIFLRSGIIHAINFLRSCMLIIWNPFPAICWLLDVKVRHKNKVNRKKWGDLPDLFVVAKSRIP